MSLMTILPLGFLVIGVAAIVAFAVSAHKAKSIRQDQAAEHMARQGCERALEWGQPRAEGSPDAVFGGLVVIVPKKSGDPARLYEKGLTIGNKRISYNDLTDVVVEALGGKKLDNCDKIWFYRKGKYPASITSFSYQITAETMRSIQEGLGFAVKVS